MFYTTGVDIANTKFEDLPYDWQYKNSAAGCVAIDIVYEKMMSQEKIDESEIEIMSSIVHYEWLSRNMWVFDPINGNPNQAVSYDLLSEDEKDKDRVQILDALTEMVDFMSGEIDLDVLEDKFGKFVDNDIQKEISEYEAYNNQYINNTNENIHTL